jgi:hypothetical protein
MTGTGRVDCGQAGNQGDLYPRSRPPADRQWCCVLVVISAISARAAAMALFTAPFWRPPVVADERHQAALQGAVLIDPAAPGLQLALVALGDGGRIIGSPALRLG